MSEIESNVSEYLKNNRIEYTITYIGETNKGDWMCDSWYINIIKLHHNTDSHKHAVIECFEYFTGLGHRKNNKPARPHITGVIYSILIDSKAYNMCFEQWVDEFGYDTDSRKAEKLYQQCIQNAQKVYSVFSSKQIEELETLIQDY